MLKPFTNADLPVSQQGRIYHLDLRPEELATDIVLVGDPDRVPFLAAHFLLSRKVEREHRGLRTITGTTANGLRLSIVTSGMGTPSTEIVLQEIVALHEIDFERRVRKEKFPQLRVIRVGTSGALRSTTRLGTPVIAAYGVGLDNTGLFYDTPTTPELEQLEQRTATLLHEAGQSARFAKRVSPYAAPGSPQLQSALLSAAEVLKISVIEGITVSNGGFFANQGRDIARCKITFPDIDRVFGEAGPVAGKYHYENMEMETSFLFHFLSALGHQAGSVNVALANRRNDTFAENPTDGVLNAAAIAVRALESVASTRAILH